MTADRLARAVLAELLRGSTRPVTAGAVLTPGVHLVRSELRVSTAAAGLVPTAPALAIAS
jgi:hypothetical protein